MRLNRVNRKKIKESRLVLFGNPSDPDVKESIRKAKLTGRAVELQRRSEFESGIGACGKKICSCKGLEQCKLQHAQI